MKVKVFSSKLVTDENLNGKGIIDIDTPEGIEIFGGQEAVDEYKRNIKINNEMQASAIKSLQDKGELN